MKDHHDALLNGRWHAAPRAVQAAALMLAPLVQGASTLLWEPGQYDYGVTSAALLAVSVALWVTGLVGLIDLVRPRLPVVAAVLLPLLAYGAIGGADFAFRGFHEAALGIDHEASLRAMADFRLQANLLLWWPGPAFPLVLLALGVTLWRLRLVASWAGVLACAAAILFPLSRAPRIQLLALLADVLLMMAFAHAGARLLRLPRRAPAGVPSDDRRMVER